MVDQWVNVLQAARLMRVCRRTIYYWIARNAVEWKRTARGRMLVRVYRQGTLTAYRYTKGATV